VQSAQNEWVIRHFILFVIFRGCGSSRILCVAKLDSQAIDEKTQTQKIHVAVADSLNNADVSRSCLQVERRMPFVQEIRGSVVAIKNLSLGYVLETVTSERARHEGEVDGRNSSSANFDLAHFHEKFSVL
jgi:hypothetical protein